MAMEDPRIELQLKFLHNYYMPKAGSNAALTASIHTPRLEA